MTRENLEMFAFVAVLCALAGCNFAPIPRADASSTAPVLVSPVQPRADPSMTPGAAPSPLPRDATPTPSFTPLPPSETLTPTDTPGPHVHTIAENDTLITIIQTYGYTDTGVLDEIVRMNDNIPNADTLPGAGATILIPRQTATPTRDSYSLTEIAQVDTPPTISVTLAVPTVIIRHIVGEGETVVGISQTYRITLEQFFQLNPDIPPFGCDFSNPSGGPDCKPQLQVGQAVNVPAPTPTPTLSPTPSGSETPTPTPTYPAPMVISPPEGGIALPAPVRLDWVSVGVLQSNEFYLVQVRDTATGAEYAHVTKNTSVVLPESMIPNDGQPHIMEWTVRIAYPNNEGIYQPIGGAPEIKTFRWQSR